MVMDAAKSPRWRRSSRKPGISFCGKMACATGFIMREISEAEKERILNSLTDRHERILFGLEPPGSGRAGERPGKSGGDLVCPLCDKVG